MHFEFLANRKCSYEEYSQKDCFCHTRSPATEIKKMLIGLLSFVMCIHFLLIFFLSTNFSM